jgi:hypothetical protein
MGGACDQQHLTTTFGGVGMVCSWHGSVVQQHPDSSKQQHTDGSSLQIAALARACADWQMH